MNEDTAAIIAGPFNIDGGTFHNVCFRMTPDSSLINIHGTGTTHGHFSNGGGFGVLCGWKPETGDTP